ncbi:metallophosphoesterase [Geothrix sp. PMB-07]|uniref:metallophosphoesterase n=1 Tax=Geothrix sp. PMB-07 TaxID=3068640 RepID=UPI00274081C5|nr:metallophosphoesterase [Geothrix sp. PMB-07]WLT31561.1 metallophosphoesterase [Geothrix sp. PMB-07]
MAFLIALILIVLVQWFHLRLLRLELPDRSQRWLPWALGLVHVPLIVFAFMRAAGMNSHNALPLLRSLARLAFYFQAFTVLHLIFGMVAEGVWRLSSPRKRDEPEQEEDTPEDAGRRAFLRTAAVASTGAAAALGVGGSRQAYGDPLITRLTLSFPDLPAGLDGLRLAQLSDLHSGPLVGAGTLRRWRELTERENPELLLFTGDLVDSRPDELQPLLEAFAGFIPPLGRFAVLGNHDFFDDPRPIWRDLENAGIRCLENASALIPRRGDTLAIMGLQDPMATNGRFRRMVFGPGPRPALAARDLPSEAFRICMNHRPSEWEQALAAGARLTLSGHTHGGQINPIPGFSSAHLIGPRTEGLFREGGDLLYVSRGLGVVGLPMRIGAPPEIVVITLKRG